MKKKMIHDFVRMKREATKITFLTAYDFPTAQFAEAAGLDMLLVGDSLGMCVYGYEGTVPVTMDQMIYHAEAVRRGAPNTFVIGDMPFMSYQTSTEKAVENAGRFLKEANCDAIKLEGGVRIALQIRAIVDAGIVVMGHIGLTPQSSGQLGGHKAQGRTAESAKLVVDELPHVHYLIVGERWSDKPESRQFERDLRAAASSRLAGRVHFLGYRSDVDRILNELCLLVHAARQEPLGRVLLEAAASGVPVVETDVGGTREIFPPGSETARLVPPDDPEAMAAAVRELMDDEGLRARLKAAARRRAEEAFDARRAAAGLVEHYREATNR